MLKHRIISGCSIVAVLLLAVYYLPSLGVLAILLAISVFAQREFYTMASRAGLPVFKVIGSLSGAALITTTFFTIGPSAEQIARAYQWEQCVFMAILIAVFVRQFPQKHNDQPLATIACTLFGVLYVPGLLNYFTRLMYTWPDGCDASLGSGMRTGRLLVLYLVVVVKSSDIGAYTFGRAWGRHKLFPRISPGKTWEGAAGGLLVSMVASVVFLWMSGGTIGVLRVHPFDAVILGSLLSVVGMVGDMFESLLKRAADMKDSGTCVPGMGGILDVLDSLLFGVPVLYAYTRLVLS